jgi:transposase
MKCPHCGGALRLAAADRGGNPLGSRRGPKRVDRPSAEWLAREYDRGRSQTDLAEECGVHVKTVQNWFRADGLATRSPREQALFRPVVRDAGRPDADLLREWYVEDGWSIDKIAAETRSSEKTIRRWLTDAGIQPRTPREQAALRAALVGDRRPGYIAALQEWSKANNGATPTLSQWAAATRAQGVPSTTMIAREFGSWRRAIAAAGLEPRPTGMRPDHASRMSPKPGRNRQMVTGGDLGGKRYGPDGGYA